MEKRSQVWLGTHDDEPTEGLGAHEQHMNWLQESASLSQNGAISPLKPGHNRQFPVGSGGLSRGTAHERHMRITPRRAGIWRASGCDGLGREV